MVDHTITYFLALDTPSNFSQLIEFKWYFFKIDDKLSTDSNLLV